jgi:ribose transport system ATP-binding protein
MRVICPVILLLLLYLTPILKKRLRLMVDLDTILSMRDITKSFGGVRALTGVTFEVRHGEIHALVGENGAGKSTLMKILSGAIKPEKGSILFKGKPYMPKDPLHARQLGISMVYQELNLALHMTLEENLMLGVEKTHYGFISKRDYRQRIDKALTLLNHPELNPTTKVMDLSQAARQIVEIARGLITNTTMFVLDEPTSSLSRVDANYLFDTMRSLKANGVSIIYISHFLEEITSVADRFTVLRDGEMAGNGIVKETPIATIIERMVGRTLTEMFPRIPHTIGEEVFRVSGLKGQKLPVDVSFSVRRGEIFGIAGLVGAGRSETLRLIFGLGMKKRGKITITTLSKFPKEITPYSMIHHGVSYLSKDRKNEGLALTRSIAENITFSTLSRLSRWGIIGNSTINHISEKWAQRLSIKFGTVSDKVSSLSGGNQQKVALARLLEENAEVYMFDEPTRGVDVGSKVQIFSLIGELASYGKAVIIVSSYIPELLGVCDTIAVMHRGKLSEKKPVSEWDEYKIMSDATSGKF